MAIGLASSPHTRGVSARTCSGCSRIIADGIPPGPCNTAVPSAGSLEPWRGAGYISPPAGQPRSFTLGELHNLGARIIVLQSTNVCSFSLPTHHSLIVKAGRHWSLCVPLQGHIRFASIWVRPLPFPLLVALLFRVCVRFILVYCLFLFLFTLLFCPMCVCFSHFFSVTVPLQALLPGDVSHICLLPHSFKVSVLMA